jgi:hypothetical protein
MEVTSILDYRVGGERLKFALDIGYRATQPAKRMQGVFNDPNRP